MAVNLAKHWIVKVRATLGPEGADDKEVSVLNRIIRWESQQLLYEADLRHVGTGLSLNTRCVYNDAMARRGGLKPQQTLCLQRCNVATRS